MKQRAFDHVIVVMFENEYRGLVLENETMKNLASKGVDMTNYFGTYHPSQTNYIASIAGEQCAWSSDGQVWPLFHQKTIVDLLESAGLEWKAYMEDYPKTPWNPKWATPAYYRAQQAPSYAPPTEAPAPSGLTAYYQKHNPFISFLSNQRHEHRWQRIVDLTQFFDDVDAGTLPQYAWITPNIWNDGHYLQGTEDTTPADRSILVEQIATWLEHEFLKPLGFPGRASKLPPRTLVVLTFDESDFEDTAFYEGPNRIYTVLLGDMVQAGTCEAEPYNHYSLIRTIEENFSLGTLDKNDASANWFRFLWNERFRWSAPAAIPASSRGGTASAVYDGKLFLVTLGIAGDLQWQSFDGQDWSQPAQVGQTASGAFALASTGSGLLLVYRTPGSRDLFALTYDSKSGWATTPTELGVETTGGLALTSFPGGGCILAYTGEPEPGPEDTGPRLPIYSLLLTEPLQAPVTTSPQALGRITAGALVLSTLGSTVYLLYSDDDGSPDPVNARMQVASYETAAFNAVPSAGPSTTVIHQWSPAPPASQTQPPPAGSLYVVGQVSQDAGIVDHPPPTHPTLIVPGSALAMAELDGCMRLITTSATTGTLLAETYSLSGVMTSASPTSTEAKTPAGYGNGWGTLMEAGWGPVEDLGSDFEAEASAPLAMAPYQGALYLFLVTKDSGKIRMAVGSC